MTAAAQLVRDARAVLLDFDGPVTPLMPWPANARAADAARDVLTHAGIEPPEDIADTTDHLAVLRWSAPLGLDLLAAVEDACTAAEVDAAQTSRPTPGALDFLRACHDAGKPVVVVSNNAAEAVHTYLNRYEANSLVRGVVGRQPHRPDLMKPHPSLILAALDLAGSDAKAAVLIGDSVTDIEVAQATGVPAVGYAKTPERALDLAAAGADAMVTNLRELVDDVPMAAD